MPKLSECAQCECTSVATSLAGYSLFHMWRSTTFSPVFFFSSASSATGAVQHFQWHRWSSTIFSPVDFFQQCQQSRFQRRQWNMFQRCQQSVFQRHQWSSPIFLVALADFAWHTWSSMTFSVVPEKQSDFLFHRHWWSVFQWHQQSIFQQCSLILNTRNNDMR